MIPDCDQLPESIRLEHDVSWLELAPRLIKDGATNDGWIRIMRCRDCGQAWRVDEPDKGHVALAIKVPTIDKAAWSADADRAARLRYLERTWGGTGSATCVWQGCPRLALRDVAMCSEHLYQQGVRARGA